MFDTITINDIYTDPTEHKALASVQFVVNGQISNVTSITLPNNAGSVAINGAGFTYTPSANFNTTRPAATTLPSFTFVANPSEYNAFGMKAPYAGQYRPWLVSCGCQVP